MWGALSDEKTGLSFIRVTVSSISHLSICTYYLYFYMFKHGRIHYVYVLYTIYTSPLSVKAENRSCPILSSSCYNGSLVTWTAVRLTAALIFSISEFALSYIANIFTVLRDSCLLPALFCYIIICVRKVENHVQIAPRREPGKITSGAESLVLQALQFTRWLSATNFQAGQA
jgi:hypothetical protein